MKNEEAIMRLQGLVQEFKCKAEEIESRVGGISTYDKIVEALRMGINSIEVMGNTNTHRMEHALKQIAMMDANVSAYLYRDIARRALE